MRTSRCSTSRTSTCGAAPGSVRTTISTRASGESENCTENSDDVPWNTSISSACMRERRSVL